MNAKDNNSTHGVMNEEPFRITSNDDAMPREIVGTLDWEEVPANDLSKNPWRLTCFLKIETNQGSMVGTGALVSNQVLITAAHNLQAKGGRKSTRITVIPGGKNQFGSVTSTKFIIPSEWAEQIKKQDANQPYDTHQDFGAIILPQALNIGFFGLGVFDTVKDLDGRKVWISGFPNAAGTMVRQAGDIQIASNPAGLQYVMDTQPGHSGSPLHVIIDNQFVCLGTHGTGWKDKSGKGMMNTATRITKDRFNTIQGWIKQFG